MYKNKNNRFLFQFWALNTIPFIKLLYHVITYLQRVCTVIILKKLSREFRFEEFGPLKPNKHQLTAIYINSVYNFLLNVTVLIVTRTLYCIYIVDWKNYNINAVTTNLYLLSYNVKLANINPENYNN